MFSGGATRLVIVDRIGFFSLQNQTLIAAVHQRLNSRQILTSTL